MQTSSTLNTSHTPGQQAGMQASWYLDSNGNLTKESGENKTEISSSTPLFLDNNGKITLTQTQTPTNFNTEILISTHSEEKITEFRKAILTKDTQTVTGILVETFANMAARGYMPQASSTPITHADLITQGQRSTQTPNPSQTSSQSQSASKQTSKEDLIKSLQKQFSELDDFNSIDAGSIKNQFLTADKLGVHMTRPWTAYKLGKTRRILEEIQNQRSAKDQIDYMLTMTQKRYGGRYVGGNIKAILRGITRSYEGDPEKLKRKLDSQYETFFKPRIELLKNTGRQADAQVADQFEKSRSTLMQRYGIEMAAKYARY